MKPNIKKLFQKSLNIESIYPESKEIPSQNDLSHAHLEEFKRQCSNIVIFPVEAKDNTAENYSQYLAKTLTHLSQIKDINFEYALEDGKIKEGVPNLSFDKKILLLDLDETLIHADFDEEFSKDEYDKIIKFKAKNEVEDEKREKSLFRSCTSEGSMFPGSCSHICSISRPETGHAAPQEREASTVGRD